MTTYTAAHFINSPAFMAIALEDAVKLVAETNGQTVELTQKAFEMEVSNVLHSVGKLVVAAAVKCADDANKGKLWK